MIDESSEHMSNHPSEWVTADLIEVGTIESMEDKAVVVAVSFVDPDIEDVSIVHRLRTREEAEAFAESIRQAASHLWPSS